MSDTSPLMSYLFLGTKAQREHGWNPKDPRIAELAWKHDKTLTQKRLQRKMREQR